MRILGILAIIFTSLTVASPSQAQSKFGIKYTWCSGDRPSPKIQISNAPKGTSEIEFRMVDQMKPAFKHGGGTVPYSNQKAIACGSLGPSYVGPFPPAPQVHDYELTATAKDKDGKVLGTTSFIRKYPEK